MKKLFLAVLGCSLLAVGTTALYGGVPRLNVIVSDATGKVAFKGTTNANAAFSTASLAPGNYVVQFQSNHQALKGKQYLVVAAAGSKKVIADAVPGEKFNGGGVAMRVSVQPGLRITGQVAIDRVVASAAGTKVKVVDGKRYLWVKGQTGSNLGDHWEEEGLAAARFVGTMSNDKLRRIQDASFEGSMINREGDGPKEAVVHGYGY